MGRQFKHGPGRPKERIGSSANDKERGKPTTPRTQAGGHFTHRTEKIDTGVLRSRNTITIVTSGEDPLLGVSGQKKQPLAAASLGRSRGLVLRAGDLCSARYARKQIHVSRGVGTEHGSATVRVQQNGRGSNGAGQRGTLRLSEAENRRDRYVVVVVVSRPGVSSHKFTALPRRSGKGVSLLALASGSKSRAARVQSFPPDGGKFSRARGTELHVWAREPTESVIILNEHPETPTPRSRSPRRTIYRLHPPQRQDNELKEVPCSSILRHFSFYGIWSQIVRRGPDTRRIIPHVHSPPTDKSLIYLFDLFYPEIVRWIDPEKGKPSDWSYFLLLLVCSI
ncbi:hypothetical protein ZHAS_00021610 [Anopheles sinensis]|uniref:Uncharacterized protein n=1 Tax=Anopheles sinensis TaxID=74873 RepID=A0A084WSV9_ANOSI|nr:hypothetical protein ZHAS_00021610 [Anopheles sinensis]